MKGKPIDKELLANLYQQHVDGQMIADLARSNGLKVATLFSALRKIGPTTRGFKRTKGDWTKLFPVNTPEAAYIYGLWAADGHITSKQWCIKLKGSDSYLLDVVRNYIGANELYYEVSKSFNGHYPAYKLIINPGRHVTVDYSWFPKNKTVVGLQFPTLSPELYSHFFRGYFDGDGSISIRTNRPNQVSLNWCSPDLMFLKSMKYQLSLVGIEARVYTEIRAHLGFKTMYRLMVGTHKSRLLLFDWMYKDKGQFFMQRKYDKFVTYVNTVLTAKQAAA